MERYWNPNNNSKPTTTKPRSKRKRSNFDEHRKMLVEAEDDGWKVELEGYLRSRFRGLDKNMDILNWWQVCRYEPYRLCLT